MKDKILELLKEIEVGENVNIIYAAEAGSRAWGFHSPDSDYDVRFVYISSLQHYLRLDKKRDVIECPINNLLDVNGWDISKVLTLANNSNATINEWLNSPIVYIKKDIVNELLPVLKSHYSKKRSIYHYCNTAMNQYNFHRESDEVRLKKYFYIIRSILAIDYILENDGIPPIEFDTLRCNLPNSLNDIVDDLLQKKVRANEITTIKRIDLVEDYISQKFSDIENMLKTMEDDQNKDWYDLNKTFFKMLEIKNL